MNSDAAATAATTATAAVTAAATAAVTALQGFGPAAGYWYTPKNRMVST